MNTEKWTGPVGRLWTFKEIEADGGPCRTNTYEHINRGELEAVKIGSRTKITDRSYEPLKRSFR
jgi:hypothetical protein